MYDIVIIGAGTAGLSAAIYGVRAGKKVLVLEGENYGGQIINSPEVANYPGIAKISGFEFATGLYEQAQNLGADIEFEAVTKVEKEGKILSYIQKSGRFHAIRSYWPRALKTGRWAWRGRKPLSAPAFPTAPPVTALSSGDR